MKTFFHARLLLLHLLCPLTFLCRYSTIQVHYSFLMTINPQEHLLWTLHNQQKTSSNGLLPQHDHSLSSSNSLNHPSPPNPSYPTIPDISSQTPLPSSTHPMTTRAKNLITKPKIHTDGTIHYPLPRALITQSIQPII